MWCRCTVCERVLIDTPESRRIHPNSRNCLSRRRRIQRQREEAAEAEAEAREKAEAEAQQKAGAGAKQKAEAEARQKAEAEAKQKTKAETNQTPDAEAKAVKEAEIDARQTFETKLEVKPKEDAGAEPKPSSEVPPRSADTSSDTKSSATDAKTEMEHANGRDDVGITTTGHAIGQGDVGRESSQSEDSSKSCSANDKSSVSGANKRSSDPSVQRSNMSGPGGKREPIAGGAHADSDTQDLDENDSSCSKNSEPSRHTPKGDSRNGEVSIPSASTHDRNTAHAKSSGTCVTSVPKESGCTSNSDDATTHTRGGPAKLERRDRNDATSNLVSSQSLVESKSNTVADVKQGDAPSVKTSSLNTNTSQVRTADSDMHSPASVGVSGEISARRDSSAIATSSLTSSCSKPNHLEATEAIEPVTGEKTALINGMTVESNVDARPRGEVGTSSPVVVRTGSVQHISESQKISALHSTTTHSASRPLAKSVVSQTLPSAPERGAAPSPNAVSAPRRRFVETETVPKTAAISCSEADRRSHKDSHSAKSSASSDSSHASGMQSKRSLRNIVSSISTTVDGKAQGAPPSLKQSIEPEVKSNPGDDIVIFKSTSNCGTESKSNSTNDISPSKRARSESQNTPKSKPQSSSSESASASQHKSSGTSAASRRMPSGMDAVDESMPEVNSTSSSSSNATASGRHTSKSSTPPVQKESKSDEEPQQQQEQQQQEQEVDYRWYTSSSGSCTKSKAKSADGKRPRANSFDFTIGAYDMRGSMVDVERRRRSKGPAGTVLYAVRRFNY